MPSSLPLIALTISPLNDKPISSNFVDVVWRVTLARFKLSRAGGPSLANSSDVTLTLGATSHLKLVYAAAVGERQMSCAG